MLGTARKRTGRKIAAGLAAVSLCLLAGTDASAKKHPPARPVDLNRASAEQLEQIPGIGPSTANDIITFREKSGPFQRVEDLLAIHGISKSKLEKLRPYVTVAPQRHSP
jgi:competence protein ComEA